MEPAGKEEQAVVSIILHGGAEAVQAGIPRLLIAAKDALKFVASLVC